MSSLYLQEKPDPGDIYCRYKLVVYKSFLGDRVSSKNHATGHHAQHQKPEISAVEKACTAAVHFVWLSEFQCKLLTANDLLYRIHLKCHCCGVAAV